MTDVFYGEISEAWEENWGAGSNPFDILKYKHSMDFMGSSVAWWANEHCTDEVAVDWGSYAWKCTGKELIQLAKEHPTVVSDIESVDPDKTYGIVLIEMY